MTSTAVSNPMLPTRAAAEYLGRSPQTLRNWRTDRKGPRYSGTGVGIRYRQSDLDAWIAANTH